MRLFYKRPLCLILCIMLGGFYFFTLRSTAFYAVGAGVLFGLLLLSFVFRDLLLGRKVLLRICLIVALLTLFLGVLWTRLFFPSEYYGETVSVSGNVVAADHSDTALSVIVLKTDTVNGSNNKHTIYITGDKDELSGVNTGDDIRLTLTIEDMTGSSGGTRSVYYIAKGYSAKSSDPESVEIISHGNYTLQYYFDSIRHSVADRFRIISNKDTGDFLAALLTGERDAVDGETELNFLRTGTSHILALSGAHLVILAYAVSVLLSVFGLNNKIKRAVIAVFVVLYMLLTGMSACVTRAGVMLLVTTAIYLSSYKSDGVTSLSISVFIIALFQPYALFDVSLWLSAFATLGLIFLSELTRGKTESASLPKKLLRALLNATLASVFAISASFIFCLVNFDSFSSLAVVATLVISPITEILIYLGMIGLAIGWFIPVSAPLILLTELIKKLAAVMAEPSFALISFDSIGIKILGVILCVAFFGLLIFGDPKKPKKEILIICSLFLALNIVGILHTTLVRYEDKIVFSPDEASNLIAVKSDGELAIVASGSGKFTSYYAASLAKELDMTRIDHYVLPSYSYFTIEQVKNTVSTVKTETVYLPRPMTSGELVVAEQISALLSRYSTELKFYDEDELLRLGEIEFVLITHAQLESEELRNAFMIKNGDSYTAYLSADCLNSYNTKVTAAIDACDALMIGGCYGAKYREITLSPSKASIIYLGADFIITEEMQEYLNRKGVSVEYTDTPINI